MSPSDTRDTKERILDAAETLFADQGFAATSLRNITTLAGVNLAAVNYHFGSKEALLSAVYARRIQPINRERIERLDRVEAAAGERSPGLETILEAFLAPAFRHIRELGEEGSRFVRLASRVHMEPNSELRKDFVAHFDEVVARYAAAFRRALPRLSDADLHWRMHFMVGAMAHTLAFSQQVECVSSVGGHETEPEDVLRSLIAYCAAGMSAAAPEPAAAGRARP